MSLLKLWTIYLSYISKFLTGYPISYVFKLTYVGVVNLFDITLTSASALFYYWLYFAITLLHVPKSIPIDSFEI